MDEARRFLRYVIPGLIFFIEVIFYLLISTYDQFIARLTCFSNSLSDKTGIGTVVAVFLTSGGLGYVFSNIYYFFHNLGFGSVDQRRLLNNAVTQGWIRFVKIDHTQITKLGAWRVVTALWKSKIETSTRIKSADRRMDTLADILHALGASIVASVLASLSWICIHKILSCNWFWEGHFTGGVITVVSVSLFIVFMFVVNYLSAKRSIEGIVYIILSEELQRGWASEIDVNKYGLPNATPEKTIEQATKN